jgi:hypothetical protein
MIWKERKWLKGGYKKNKPYPVLNFLAELLPPLLLATAYFQDIPDPEPQAVFRKKQRDSKPAPGPLPAY